MGGSSSQVTGYRYFANFLLFIGNPIENLIGINFDKRGWITGKRIPHGDNGQTIYIESPSLYGENEGGVFGRARLKLGTNNQTVDDKYNEYMKSIGLQASAYPYQSYLSFSGSGKVDTDNGWIDGVFSALAGYMNDAFYVGNSGYMKEMLLWPKRTRVRNDGRRQWYEVRGDGAVVCEIDETLIPIDYSKKVQNIIDNPPTNKWYGTSNKDDQYYEFTKNGLLTGYVHNFESQYGGYGKIGYVKTSFSGITDVWLEIEIWADDGISSFMWTGGDIILISEFSSSGYPTCRKYLVFCGGGNSLSFGISDQVPIGSGMRHSCVISVRLFETPWAVSSANALDINPIHKIREILTDDTAMNKPDSSVNNENFIKAADWIWNEGLGVSWSITEKSCMDAINELCYHIEAGIRVNRQTGLYEMVLFRDNWFDESEIHTIAENKIKKGSMQYEITNADEVVNQVNVNYYDRANIKNSSFSISESGLIQTLGRVNAETVDFPYFMNMRNAEIVANWKLKILSTGVLKGSFTTGWREARKWNRYDLIRLPWSKRWAGTILVRIMNIKLGGPTSNEVSIEWVEVVPSTGMMNTTIVADDPVDTQPEAPKPCNAKVFELPYFEAVQAFGERETGVELTDNPEIGYLCAIAEKPQNNSLNAALYADSGSGFERVATVNYCETAYLDQAIDRVSSSFVVKNVGNIASIRLGSQIFINDETMVYQSYDAETKVLTVKRGAFGVPQIHTANSILYFADDFIAVDQTLYVDGETIQAKVLTTTPSGVLALGDAFNHEVGFNARAIRPYPPANVKINGEYWTAEIETDLIITWVDRNRVQQTGGEIIGWYEGGVTIETGVTYQLVLVERDKDGIELRTQNLSLGGLNTYTFATSAMNANTRTIEITLKSLRDGYESYSAFNHMVELSQFFSAPYNFTVEFKND